MALLSTKELNYVKDLLSFELLIAKKCKQYSDQEVDAHFKGVFNQAGQLHQQNYLSLVDYLAQVKDSQGGVNQ
ncbi:hypothetical protein [Clostridium sp. DJ247]|uniref:hypothetical protein n=1 Tax=Clostridium sp. DJ247 TaxID=2726188 RepID=UPI001623E401|nr:hypothetical protein [Clostridium sp. DJ247]MBC2580954.1 hypothetical protein [Clostridium sp. DJ247]